MPSIIQRTLRLPEAGRVSRTRLSLTGKKKKPISTDGWYQEKSSKTRAKHDNTYSAMFKEKRHWSIPITWERKPEISHPQVMHRILQSCLPDTLVLTLYMPSSRLLSKPVYPSSGEDMPWKTDLEILILPWPGNRLSLRLIHQALVSLIHVNQFS